MATRGRRRSVWGPALALQVLIVVITLAIAEVAVYINARDELRDQYGERALAVAHTVANMPTTRDALLSGTPGGELQELVEQIRLDTGLTYIVVGDPDWVRYTHPEPDRIGEKVSTDPSDALAGQTEVVVETGTLGETMRAKLPVVDPASGEIIGFMSAGISTAEIGNALRSTLWAVFLCGLLGLAVGLTGSWLLARRLRRDTRGLAAADIATLYEHREAMLLSIREGVVTVDMAGLVTLVNDEARRLLELDGDVSGQHFADIVASPALGSIADRAARRDETVINDGRLLVVSQRPVVVDGTPVGSVITLRDRTELQQLVGELVTAKKVTDSLRAQAHEYTNRMHTVAGLIELGQTDEALGFIASSSRIAQSLTEAYTDAASDPTLLALLLAKSADALERGVEFEVHTDANVQVARIDQPDEIVTAIGNLIDNAFDAATAAERPALVRLELTGDGLDLVATVDDSGAGVNPHDRQRIFDLGYSTKGADGRGIGLALVLAAAVRRGGTLELLDEGSLPGARFRVRLPGMLLAPERAAP
ncbi:MAG TPA: sensor histidine kinase [Ilumatobacter sp.]|nr:sensor histidine kinase [Ilumatobacter sp.]